MNDKKTAPAVPELVIDGKKYKAVPPKAKAWRDFTEFEENAENIPATEFIDKMAELIAGVFDESVTADVILNNVTINQIKPLYKQVLLWIIGLVNGKMEQIPNAEAETAD